MGNSIAGKTDSGPLTMSGAADAFNEALGAQEESTSTPESQNPEEELSTDADADASMEEEDISSHDDEENMEEPSNDAPELDNDDIWSKVVEFEGEEITVNELKRGFLRNRDYTQKTQAVAEKRKYLEAHEENLATLQERSGAVLGMLTKQAEQELDAYKNVDWTRLLDSDQTKYMKHKAKYDQAKERLHQVHAETQNFFQHLDNVKAQKHQAQAKECLKELRTDINNWNDDLYRGLIDYGVKTGLSEKQLAECTDPKLFKVLMKAQKYDAMKKNAKQKKTAPRKVMSTKAARKKALNPNNRDRVMSNLRKTGSRHAAADAFLELGI